MQSFVKIKSSQIGKIARSFTYISKSFPCREFLTSQICVLMLFAKISKFTVVSSYKNIGVSAGAILKKKLFAVTRLTRLKCHLLKYLMDVSEKYFFLF